MKMQYIKQLVQRDSKKKLWMVGILVVGMFLVLLFACAGFYQSESDEEINEALGGKYDLAKLILYDGPFDIGIDDFTDANETIYDVGILPEYELAVDDLFFEEWAGIGEYWEKTHRQIIEDYRKEESASYVLIEYEPPEHFGVKCYMTDETFLRSTNVRLADGLTWEGIEEQVIEQQRSWDDSTSGIFLLLGANYRNIEVDSEYVETGEGLTGPYTNKAQILGYLELGAKVLNPDCLYYDEMKEPASMVLDDEIVVLVRGSKGIFFENEENASTVENGIRAAYEMEGIPEESYRIFKFSDYYENYVGWQSTRAGMIVAVAIVLLVVVLLLVYFLNAKLSKGEKEQYAFLKAIGCGKDFLRTERNLFLLEMGVACVIAMLLFIGIIPLVFGGQKAFVYRLLFDWKVILTCVILLVVFYLVNVLAGIVALHRCDA